MEMKIKINEVPVKVEFVHYLENDYIGLFDARKNSIKILVTSDEKRDALVHELTLDYLHYHGFTNAPLNDILVCNFMVIYGEKIIEQVNEILLKLEWS